MIVLTHFRLGSPGLTSLNMVYYMLGSMPVFTVGISGIIYSMFMLGTIAMVWIAKTIVKVVLQNM